MEDLDSRFKTFCALSSAEPVGVEAVSLGEMGRKVPCSAYMRGLSDARER